LEKASSMSDQSETAQLQEELRKSQDMLRQAQAVSQTGSWVTYIQEDTLEWTEETYRIFGVPPGYPLHYENFMKLVHPEDQAALQAKWVTAFQEGFFEIEHRILVQGEVRWVVENAQLEFNEDMVAVRAFGTVRDITARKQAEEEKHQLEEQLRHAQKMQAVGTLAGGIAHDFKNILGVIMGHAEIALKSIDFQDERNRMHLDKIFKVSQRANDLTKQILTFSRKEDIRKEPLLFTTIIRDALRLLRVSLPSSIDVKEQLHAEEAMVFANATQIHQVIFNLCTNSAYAMGDTPGTLTISVDAVDARAEDDSGGGELKPGAYLELLVRDTGSGISQDNLPRVFEPFFTTKKTGEGSGMGLSVVHGIVKEHGGSIRVHSEDGHGATIRILLPVTTENAEELTVDAYIPRRGSGRILVLDDERALLNIYRLNLEAVGFEVETFHEPDRALERIAQSPNDFDLYICDQMMPGMTGLQFLQEARSLHKDVPTLLCTAYGEGFTQESLQAVGVSRMLAKPILQSPLYRAVFNILDAAG
jgi:two-component system, cell cycle sensor histidine kinase and response regulator CckA